MISRSARAAACAAAVSALAAVPRGVPHSPEHAPAAVRAAAFAARPLAFERNDGQYDPRVRFVARGGRGTAFLTEDGLTVAPRGAAPLRLRFEGGAAVQVEGAAPLPGVVHHIRGNDPSRWRTNVPTYSRAVCRGVWPGIDVVFRGGEGEIAYDLEAAPGADLDRIALRFEGADEVAVDGGDLVVACGGARYRHTGLRVLEEGRSLAGAFRVRGDGSVGFRVEGRDPARALVIDPVIAYGTYLGGSDAETPHDVAVDASGNAYVTGSASSVDFPLAAPLPGAPGAGSTDVFVTKLNPSGATMLFSTFYGGEGSDIGWAVQVDGTGVYVAGSTTSADFPGVGPLRRPFAGGVVEGDAFLAKLAPDGSQVLSSSTFGGSGDEGCRGLALDAAGAAYLGGFTTSADFPVTPTAYQASRRGSADGWLLKVHESGESIAYATYFGGSSAPDVIEDVAVDAGGRLYACGYTASEDLPAAGALRPFHGGGGLDGFVAKLDRDGAFAACTYLGGVGSDGCRSVAVDASGAPHVAGFTASLNFPVLGAVQPSLDSGDGTADGFVAALHGDLASLLFSTYFGGRTDDDVQAIAVAADGSVLLAGNTTSVDFPNQGALQASLGGSRDAFAAKLSAGGAAIEWSTYAGGPSVDAATAVATDAFGDAYVVLTAGDAAMSTLCGAQPAFAGGEQDGFVLKLTDDPSSIPAAPFGLAARATAYRVDLEWSDASRNECAFRVERLDDATGVWRAIAAPDTNVTSFADLDVEPDRRYSYRVVASNPLGESAPSEEAAVATSQTIEIAQRAGRLTESDRRRRDRVDVASLLRFTVDSADRSATPSAEAVEVAVGAEGDPVRVAIAAADPRWKTRGDRSTWTSPRRAVPRVRLEYRSGEPSLRVTVSRLDFPTTPAGSLHLALRAGDDAGHVTRAWSPQKKKPGRFRLP